MAVPKKKVTPSRRGQRRAHDGLSLPAIQENRDTGEWQRRHHISPDGWYRGRQVIKPKAVEADATSAE